MTDNVIIFGAGASADANIPVLANFVDKMLELGIRGTNGQEKLSDKDNVIFRKVMDIREELNGYHGRASFDDRNIEDILSLLSFNLIGGKKSDQDKLEWMTKAITRTIELVCTVKFSLDELGIPCFEDSQNYIEFWYHLFKRFEASKSLPTLITFNYDLVLERALFQLMFNGYFDSTPDNRRFPFDGLRLRYHYKLLDDYLYQVRHVIGRRKVKGTSAYKDYRGTMLSVSTEQNLTNIVDIEILKLHGSINFPKHKTESGKFPITAVEDANILPPLLHKWAGKNETEIWRVALDRLRNANNVIIVGYSLPQTDIYMQNFLKAGLGPNLNLNKITVFDPVLFRSDKHCQAMEERYGNCFSPQLQSRIIFRPIRKYSRGGAIINEELAGTFKHFTQAINEENNEFFF